MNENSAIHSDDVINDESVSNSISTETLKESTKEDRDEERLTDKDGIEVDMNDNHRSNENDKNISSNLVDDCDFVYLKTRPEYLVDHQNFMKNLKKMSPEQFVTLYNQKRNFIRA